MDPVRWRVVLRYLSTVPGALSVMTTGTSVMQRLFAESWASLGQSVLRASLTLAVESVREQSPPLQKHFLNEYAQCIVLSYAIFLRFQSCEILSVFPPMQDSPSTWIMYSAEAQRVHCLSVPTMDLTTTTAIMVKMRGLCAQVSHCHDNILWYFSPTLKLKLKYCV